ncbi:RDD family protein [Solimonas marina]|uniref:RDD family protein n=1 Tax=Solimonas marina TaxID=2714601 RepID=A0A969WBY0_9GAMM|nr:RDD family protein [Solimonas marina]NKF23290.1 RDD family protein [Solimonas marina]
MTSSDAYLPAPLWRRLAAAVYDGLLLLALWMVAVMADTAVRAAAGLPPHPLLLRVVLFSLGMLFFGWFWRRGGQTLGMRAWRLRLQADDERRPLDWLRAAIRYAVMLLIWTLALTPMLARLPVLRSEPHADLATGVAVVVIIGVLLAARLDARRRLPHDWLSGSRPVLIAAPAGAAGHRTVD